MNFSVYLFRHGMTELNEQHKYCGFTDIPLSDKGKQKLLQRKYLFLYPNILDCKVVTSSMLRCEQTLFVLYGNILHEQQKDFKEINFGIFENKSYEELKQNSEYQKWICGNNKANVCPNGESGIIMEQRVLNAFKTLINNASSNIALFTHAGPIASIMNFYFPKENKNIYEWQPDFGCGYELVFDDKNIYYNCIPTVRG